ncbi:hypothetical protein SCALM49S_08808 [Streptomyces californicus]
MSARRVVLQDFGSFDEDAELGAAAGADHEGGGGGEAEGAGAGDDEDGDGRGEGGGESGAVAEPVAEGGEGEGDDDGDEDGGGAVGEALCGGLAVLGVLDELGHAGELGVGADAGGFDDEASAGVEGGSGDGVAGRDLDGDGLAGEHRGVDGRRALDHGPVRRDLLPRTIIETYSTTSVLAGTRTSPPSRSTAASFAPRCISVRSAAPDFRLARASR